ncbi:MAG: NUDIX domain-containing protein [Chloroflexi bacterium]|nr:NUDIX domain-containing protein [Chloroflexota bacterium]
MTRRVSAGILLYRDGPAGLEVLLAHPGGPYFANRNIGHWTIPKGEPGDEDDLFAAGAREFHEETGHALAAVAADPAASPLPLGSVIQASGKVVHAWAVRGDLDPARASSNTFEINWPPGSSTREVFPEIDRVAWFPIEEARRRANRSQAAFIERLLAKVEETEPTSG